jgi:hypothetical protein
MRFSVSVRVKCLVFLTGFNKNFNVATDFSKTPENPFMRTGFISCKLTNNTHDEDSSFTIFVNVPKNASVQGIQFTVESLYWAS